MAFLQPGTFPAYAANYISLVDTATVKEAVEKYASSTIEFFKNIPTGKVDHRYAENKWSIKEMLQHIIDAERIFSYRALRLARKDKTPLPGFDENTYALASNADARKWKDLLEEFEVVRRSSDLLIKSFTDEQYEQMGSTNGQPTSVKAIGFILYGHMLHHKNILEERYL